MIPRTAQVARVQKKISGPELVGMGVTLEAFVVAMAASEAKTRPDPKAFIKQLRTDAVEGANRFGNQEAASGAEVYADQLIGQIMEEAGLTDSADPLVKKPD